jgi:bifunctional NMN adenylyltransferase/nudix hydrolase
MHKTGVYIGRFQPFHVGHMHMVQNALDVCEQLVMVVGSAGRARTVKNPWTFLERKALIEKNLAAYDAESGEDTLSHVVIKPVEDQFYHEAKWVSDVEAAVGAQDDVVLVGHDKDHSTYYLKCFPRWHYQEIENFNNVNATPIRTAYFEGRALNHISGDTQAELDNFKATEHFARLVQEHRFLNTYRASWASTPYPMIHTTTHAVVMCDNHVLLIERGGFPGKGLWALPGGYLEAHEWALDGVIRELHEETELDVDAPTLKQNLKAFRAFDHPDRSQVGRMITHVGYFVLPGKCPSIAAADDAADAKWVPLKIFHEMSDAMHDDHYQVLQTLLRTVNV